MDFRPTEDQKALRAGVRSFCEGRVPSDRLADLEKSGGFDRTLWLELAEMGVFSLRLADERGGLGLGHADAAMVFEELGRSLVPGPVLWSHLAAGLVEGAEAGTCVVGGLAIDRGATRNAGAAAPIVIEHLDCLDVLLVLDDEGVERIDPGTLDAKAVNVPLDPLTPIHEVAALPRGERIGDATAANRIRESGTALTSALQLGLAQGALDLATDYAKTREQFGRPIGGFQAVKHILAEMFVHQEAARAGAYNAAASLDAPDVADVERAVSSAKLTAGESAIRNARSCIQVHGGMGFTWEVLAHYYLKRAWVLENTFGTQDDHAERIADLLEAAVDAEG